MKISKLIAVLAGALTISALGSLTQLEAATDKTPSNDGWIQVGKGFSGDSNKTNTAGKDWRTIVKYNHRSYRGEGWIIWFFGLTTRIIE